MNKQRQNILITSAGRRVELLQGFMEQRDKLMPKSVVHTTDMRPSHSAAAQIADVFIKSPAATDPTYPDFLFNYCNDHSIGMVVPTIDTELLVLANMRQQLKDVGTHAIISSPAFIKLCRDKNFSGRLFSEIGIRYPKIMRREELQFPCFVKPMDGSSSIGARVISNREELNTADLTNQNLIFMELIGKDFIEFTVDAYFDRNGAFKCAVPRNRLEVRAGEVSKSVTRRDSLSEHLQKNLHAWKGASGCITVQLFYNKQTTEIVGLEINPRFGGGFPLSYASGAHYPGWLIREYFLSENLNFYDSWEADLLMLRYDAKVLVKNAP